LDPAVPVPNTIPTYGTNEPVEFTSGQEWRMQGYNNEGPSDANMDDFHYSIQTGAPKFRMHWPNPDKEGRNGDARGPQLTYNDGTWTNHQLDPLTNGDDVRVVWTASSGGKTQELFEYTVQ
jgi:hypothetical protein